MPFSDSDGSWLVIRTRLSHDVMHCEAGPPAVLSHFMPADAYGKVNGGNVRYVISLVTHFVALLAFSTLLTEGVVLRDNVSRYVGSGSQTRGCSPIM